MRLARPLCVFDHLLDIFDQDLPVFQCFADLVSQDQLDVFVSLLTVHIFTPVFFQQRPFQPRPIFVPLRVARAGMVCAASWQVSSIYQIQQMQGGFALPGEEIATHGAVSNIIRLAFLDPALDHFLCQLGVMPATSARHSYNTRSFPG